MYMFKIFLALIVGILSFISTYIIGSENYIELDLHQGLFLITIIPILLIILATTIYYLHERR